MYYYLIQCETDKSLCIVKEDEVICDSEVVKNGDIVTFFWSSKEYVGQIFRRSEDYEFLMEEMKKMKRTEKTSKKSKLESPSTGTTTTSLGKRKSVKPKSFSASEANAQKIMKRRTLLKRGSKSENPNAKKSKVSYKKSQNTERTRDSSDTQSSENDESGQGKENVPGNSTILSSSTSSSERSPSKDDLKLQLIEYKKLVAEQSAKKFAKNNNEACNKPKTPEPSADNLFDEESRKSKVDDLDESTDSGKGDNLSIKSTGHESEDDSTEVKVENGDESSQLFGGDYSGEEMIMLENGIYCEKKIYKQALGSSHLATHVARKLIEGVFRNSALLKCTMSGRAVRSQGKERQHEEVSCMHEKARDSIINFSMKIAKHRGWTVQSESKIKSAMTQKLVEIKHRARMNINARRDPNPTKI